MLLHALLLCSLGAAPAPTPTSSDAGALPPASARPVMAPDVKSWVDRMQAFYERTDDFTASFRQDYTYKSFKRTQTSSGKVAFKKPGKMRWDYEKPSPKAFVLFGDKAYAYDPAAMTLTKANLDTNQLSASVTFLWGKGRLADEFAITKAVCATCKGVLLVLDPLKADPRFRQVKLEVDPKTAKVMKSTVIDPDGSENAIAFSDFKGNVGIGEDRFALNPPAGTQIVDLTKPRP